MGSGGAVDSECVLSAECQSSHDFTLVAWKLRFWWTRCCGLARPSQPGQVAVTVGCSGLT